MTQFKFSCQITLDSLKYSVVLDENKSSHSRKKVRRAFMPVKLTDIVLSLARFLPPFSHPLPFFLLIAGNNCINNRKTVELDFMHHDEVF